MGYGTSRPPVTEGVADAMVREIKSHEGKAGTSEVLLAFQSARAPVDPVVIGAVRRQMATFAGFAFVVLAILLVIWWAA